MTTFALDQTLTRAGAAQPALTALRVSRRCAILGDLLRLWKRLRGCLFPLLASGILPFTVAAQSKIQTHLTVEVQLTQQAHGELAYLIFASSSGFPGDRDKALRHGFLPIPANAQHLRIETDLPPGTYAVAVYEDLNSNHKLDHNLIGIPREPVGVSNNPSARFGPPHFDQSSFRLGDTAQTITITLVHP